MQIIQDMLEKHGASPDMARDVAAAIAVPGTIARTCFDVGRSLEQLAYIERERHPVHSEQLLPDGIRIRINHGPCHPSPYNA
jgi:hypothetical protein